MGRALTVAALGLVVACARLPTPASPDEVLPELRLPRDVRPLRYAIELTIAPEREGFRGRVAVELELGRRVTALWLHSRDLVIHDAAVEVGGQRVPAGLAQVTPEGVARLSPAIPLSPGHVTLHVAFSGSWSDRPEGLHRLRSGGAAYAYTHLEPTDARRVFPCFDDPGFETPFDVTLIVPEGDVAVSNAPAVAEDRVDPGMKRVTFATTPPLPTYLVTAAVGPFDVVSPPPLPPDAVRPRPLALRGLAPHGSGERLGLALAATRELLPALEQWLGVPFPYPKLDQIAVPDLPEGGAGAAGAALYAADRVGFQEGGSSERKRVEVGGLVARELARQWLGALATPGWWDDAWLTGSFATFLSWKMVRAWRPDAGAGEEAAASVDAALQQDELAGARALRRPIRRMADVEDQLDRLAYVKGGSVLDTFERFMGEERFRSGIHAYLEANAHGTGTTAALVAALSRAAGRDLAPAFRSLLDQPGAPLVEARTTCDEPGPRVELQVSRYRPPGSSGSGGSFVVPVCARYEAAGVLGEACTLVEHGHGTIALPACPRWVMPDAGARSYYRWMLAAPDRARLSDAGFAHLTAAERLSYAQSVRASARSGAVPYREALEALAPLAHDGARLVATSPMPALRTAIEDLVPEADRASARVQSAELFRGRLRELGLDPAPGEPLERTLLRRDLVVFLVQVARDPEVTRLLAGAGAAYAGLVDSRWHPEAVSADLAGVALAAAVVTGDVASFDALSDRLHVTDDAEQRWRIVGALGSARDPVLSARALALVGDPRLHVAERARLLLDQASHVETREAAWKTLRSRWDVLAATLPPSSAARLADVPAGFCDRERIPEVQRFLRSRVEKIPGGPRHLARTLDAIATCAALRDAQGTSAAAYFAR